MQIQKLLLGTFRVKLANITNCKNCETGKEIGCDDCIVKAMMNSELYDCTVNAIINNELYELSFKINSDDIKYVLTPTTDIVTDTIMHGTPRGEIRIPLIRTYEQNGNIVSLKATKIEPERN